MSTSDGRELKGMLLASHAKTIELRQVDDVTEVPIDDIRLIEATDRLDNGARRGALGAGIALGIFAFRAFWHGGERENAPLAGVLFGGIGAGLGALGGALVDSFVEGRRVLYRAPGSVAIFATPLVSPTAAGATVGVAW